MPVRIVTDSACDLPEPICEELGIEVVPLTIRFGDREYVDRKELSVDAFWRELESSSVLPETVGPVGRRVRGDVPASQRRRRRRRSSASTSRRACRRRCSPRRSRPRRSTVRRRSRSSTRSARRWASETSCCTRHAARATALRLEEIVARGRGAP